MRASFTLSKLGRYSWFVVAGLAGFVLAAVVLQVPNGPTHAQTLPPSAFGSGGLGSFPYYDDEEYVMPERIFIRAPVSTEEARVWIALNQSVDFPFENETPLRDVLQFVKTATDSDDLPGGIRLYVDPVGMTEADTTLESEYNLNIAGVSLATGLDLILKQRGLTFFVRKDGIVMITVEHDEETEERLADDLKYRLLNELEEIRTRVRKLEPPRNDRHYPMEAPPIPPGK